MSFTPASVMGAFGFLILGLLELALMQRTLYPALRWRHEQAKLTQTQGIEPSWIMTLIRVQSLLILPLLGFMFGDRLKELIG